MSTLTGANILRDADYAALQDLYSMGYGMWPEGTVVYDPWRKIDNRKAFAKIIRKKAIMDSTTALIHATTDQEVLDYTRLRTPLQELIPVETMRGKTANWDTLASRTVGGPVAETVSSLTAQTDTYVAAQLPAILWLEVGGWTDFSLLALRNQVPPRDLRALTIRNKLQNLAEGWERELIFGNLLNASTYTNTSAVSKRPLIPANESKGFTGLIQMALASSSGNGVAFINSKGNSAVTAEDIDNMIANGQDANVNFNLALTDQVTLNYLKSIVMGNVRIDGGDASVAFGINALQWRHQNGALNFVVEQYLPTEAGYRMMVFVDTSMLAQRILLDTTVEMIAKTYPSENFMVKKFGTLIDKFNYSANSSAGMVGRASVGLVEFLA